MIPEDALGAVTAPHPGTYDCLTDPASGIPQTMSQPDPGPVADGPTVACAVCSRSWTLREVAGFVVWTPS